MNVRDGALLLLHCTHCNRGFFIIECVSWFLGQRQTTDGLVQAVPAAQLCKGWWERSHDQHCHCCSASLITSLESTLTLYSYYTQIWFSKWISPVNHLDLFSWGFWLALLEITNTWIVVFFVKWVIQTVCPPFTHSRYRLSGMIIPGLKDWMEGTFGATLQHKLPATVSAIHVYLLCL